MYCNDAFSIYQLNESSYENEVFRTGYCIPNDVKFAFFVFYIVVYGCVFIWLNYLIFLARGTIFNKSWTTKKSIYMLCWFGCIGHLVTFTLFMLGIQSRYKFLVFILVPISNRSCDSIYIFTNGLYLFTK
jgi:hypothetical protein